MKAFYNSKSDTVDISVRSLCEFVLRGGNIDTRPVPGNKNGSCVVAHSLSARDKEMTGTVSFTTVSDGTGIKVYSDERDIEIKGNNDISYNKVYTVPYRINSIENGEREISYFSALCSSYIICKKKNLPFIRIKILFIDCNNEESKTEQYLSLDDISDTFEKIVSQFSPYARIIKQRSTKCIEELKNLHFPFESGARDGQKEFIIDTFRAIKTHSRLMVEAPTGTGKTIGSLYPSIKAIGDGSADKVFYFTGKTTTAKVALNAIELMRKEIPDFRVIHITSKEKCCKNFSGKDRRKCNPKECERTRAYFDKINTAILELLQGYRTYTFDIIENTAKKYGICSYELSLELSEWCELIICDYNYLFDLRAYFRRYFEFSPDANYVFLIDEAHNLPNRARDMYSVTLKRSDFVSLNEKYKSEKSLKKPLESILQKFDFYYQLAISEKQEIDGEVYGFYINSELSDDFENGFAEFIKGCRKLFSKDINDSLLNEQYSEVLHLLSVVQIYDKRFTMYVQTHNDEVIIRILCLDPSKMLNEKMNEGISTILFSATLTPKDYFADVLGCEKSNTLSLKSPFDKKNLCLLSVNNVSTRFDDRKKSVSVIANIIRASIAGKEGNYIVYFPSYSYLSDVKEEFEKKFPKIRVTAQKKSMSDKAKREFLSSFDEKKEGSLVGFCVLGGSFSEGIDLRGERLIGAVIVGVGLPTISTELNIIKEYFDKTRENGYAYSYTYPGMIKVLQASGRVIRSEDEKGIVVLVDDRFSTGEYRELMPEYWNHIKYTDNARDLLNTVSSFWKK